MLEFEESLIGWISRVTYDSGHVTSDLRNSLPVNFWSVTFSILYQHYINSHYPRNIRRRGSIFWRNFWKKNLNQTLERLRLFLLTIFYIISLKFSSTLTSPFTHPWEVLSPNTYLTHSECWEKFWCLLEVLEEAIEWRMQSGEIAGFG